MHSDTAFQSKAQFAASFDPIFGMRLKQKPLSLVHFKQNKAKNKTHSLESFTRTIRQKIFGRFMWSFHRMTNYKAVKEVIGALMPKSRLRVSEHWIDLLQQWMRLVASSTGCFMSCSADRPLYCVCPHDF